MIVFAIIVVIALISIILSLNTFSSKFVVNEKLISKQVNCYSKTGFIYQGKCVCKHNQFVTNNLYNNNCDVVVDPNCKRLVDLNGNLINFETQDPFKEGVCECKPFYTYNSVLRKCVLQKLSDDSKESKVCDDGFYFAQTYQTCLKQLCTWDILNPKIRLDQTQIEENVCSCDFNRGIVTVVVANVVACTRAVKSDSNVSHFCILNKENKLTHFYPKSLIEDTFKQNTNLLDYVGIVQSSGSWLSDLEDGNVRFYTEYGTQRKEPSTYINSIFSNINENVKKPRPFTPISIQELHNEPTIDGEESWGDLRKFTNQCIYSPIVRDQNKQLIINPLGVEQNVYDHVLCYYNAEQNILLLRTVNNKQNNYFDQ